MTITKIMKNKILKNQFQNYENYENLKDRNQNQDNHTIPERINFRMITIMKIK